MNVLWVEDFGGGLKADWATLVNMFRGLLSERVFDDEWNPEADLLGQPAYLRDFFPTHSPTHQASLLRHFGDFQAMPESFPAALDAVAVRASRKMCRRPRSWRSKKDSTRASSTMWWM